MEKHELQVVIEELHERYKPLEEGQVATYIPELSKADPEAFGIALVSAEGQVFQTGDCDLPFTIQSISKPFTFGLAIEAYGTDWVARHVGVEPSGDAFNAIELQNGTNRPFNPMVNSGAITVTALLHERYGDETFDIDARALEPGGRAHARCRRVRVRVRAAHRPSQPRHRAPAAELRHGARRRPRQALDVYFRQCSILVTCRDLAMMGATLANMGRNPVTDEQVFDLTVRAQHAVDHVHVRDVRLLGRVGLSRRRAGEERRRRRRNGGGQPSARHRHVFAEARQARQQRARHRSLRRAGLAFRPARVRLPERRLRAS